MVIKLVLSPPGKDQPHERQRQRGQCPREFVGRGLQLVEQELGVLEAFLDLFVECLVPRVDAEGAGNVQGFGCHAVDHGGCGGQSVDVAVRVFELLIDFGDRLLFGNGFGPLTLQIDDECFGLDEFSLKVGDLRAICHGCAIGLDPDWPADAFERCKHQEHEEQEQREWRYEPCALAVDVASRQVTRPPCEHWQGSPDLPFEMKDAVQDVVEDRE